MSAYNVPPYTWTRTFTEWTFDPTTAVLVVAVGVVYALGVRRVRKAGGTWSRGLVAYLVLALVVWVLANMSCLGVYQDVLFWPRAVQNMLLLMVVPMFLAEAAPLTLLRANLRPDAVARLGRARRSRTAVVLTFPLFPSGIFVATPFVLYLSPWYPATLHGGVVPDVTRVALIVIGLVYFWTRVQADPVPKRYPHLVSMWLTFSEVIFDGALGLYLVFGNHLIAASHYHAVARTWGPSLQRDQIFGGGALAFTGDLAGLPFLAILFFRMIRDDTRRAEQIDRELDEQQEREVAEVKAAVAAGRVPADEAEVLEEGMMRPWWEKDPRFVGRYGRE